MPYRMHDDVPLPVHRTGRGWPKAGRGALFGHIAVAFAPHPALRATFSPRSGEKG